MIKNIEQIEYEDVPTYNGGVALRTKTNSLSNEIAIQILQCAKTNADIIYLNEHELRHVRGRYYSSEVEILEAIRLNLGPIRIKNNTIYYAGTTEEVDVELAKQIIVHDLEVKLLNFNVYMNN